MKFFLRTLPLLLLCTVLSPLTSFAWNAVGHMVVASIAYQQLKPAARDKVDRLVNTLHQEYPNTGSFLQIASWMDEIRAQRIDTYTHWHYIDVPYSKDGTQAKNLIDTDNAAWAVNHIETVVKNNQANVYERARFLAFLVHIVGDLHQPLHTVAFVSAAHPNGDKGGNAYFVRYNGERVNLHKIWDEGVGAFDQKNVSSAQINDIANQITALYPVSIFGKQAVDLNTDTWLQEGMANAQKYVYNTSENQPVSSGYVESGKLVAEKQAALAGYRLGALLNQLLA